MTETAARRTASAVPVHPVPAPPPVGGRRRRRLADQARAYGFLLGGLICFALFSWYPAIRAVVIAFQKYTPGSPPEWVGTANFSRVLHDPEFGAAWRNTLTFTLLALLIGFAVPFVLALVLNELRHAKAFFRVVVYLPVMIPPVVSALLWKWFYDPGAGLANETLRFLHPSHLELDQRSRHRSGVAGARGDLGQHGRHRPDLPGRPPVHPGRAVRGRGTGRREPPPAHQARDDPQTRFVILMLMLLQIIATCRSSPSRS